MPASVIDSATLCCGMYAAAPDAHAVRGVLRGPQEDHPGAMRAQGGVRLLHQPHHDAAGPLLPHLPHPYRELHPEAVPGVSRWAAIRCSTGKTVYNPRRERNCKRFHAHNTVTPISPLLTEVDSKTVVQCLMGNMECERGEAMHDTDRFVMQQTSASTLVV